MTLKASNKDCCVILFCVILILIFILDKSCGSKVPIDLTTINNYTLQSPGYPNGYANNLECEWTFTTGENNHLVAIFTEIDLDANFHSFMTSCYGDYVQIYSGFDADGSKDWKSVAKLCTKNSTHQNFETSNYMKIVFNSNTYLNYSGFSVDIFQSKFVFVLK